MRLARYLGTSAEFWMGLQPLHDLREAQRQKFRRIEREAKPNIRSGMTIGSFPLTSSHCTPFFLEARRSWKPGVL